MFLSNLNLSSMVPQENVAPCLKPNRHDPKANGRSRCLAIIGLDRKGGAGGTADSTPTEPLIDSGFDSQQYCKNKKAHRIMGLVAITGGDAGIRTLDPGFAQMRP